MYLTIKMIAFALILAVLRPGFASAQIQAADIVFTNGNVYTAADNSPRAEAVAVKGGRIIFVGANAGAKPYQGAATRVVDLRGMTVVPGLTDAHMHLAGVGRRELTLNLEGTNTLASFLAKVKERVDAAALGEWVTGRGWIETFWRPSVFPTRADLDKISPNNPVLLTRADGHASVANSRALTIAGIDRNTANPFGGELLRDKQTGEAAGMLIDKAQALVSKHVPAPTDADREEALLAGARRSLALGWCQVQNAGSTYGEVELLNKLYADGRMKLRVYNAVYGPGADAQRLLRDGPGLGSGDERFTMRAIKVVLDGALGSRGAALLQPYADAETSGFLTAKPEELAPMFEEALRRGVQIETHAIGDRANRTIFELYEKAFKAVPPDQRKIREPRWRIEHAQILDAADLQRFAKLGVIASMQPSHAISDLFFAPSRLGQDRLKGAYAWASLLKSGAMVVGGSDAPVERGEPMIEFYAAVARKSLKGETGAGWHPEEAVTREQALKMFTLWPAHAAFAERERGSIEVGKLADLTVLSKDIMRIPEAEILQTECVMTVIGGEVVFDAGNKQSAK